MIDVDDFIISTDTNSFKNTGNYTGNLIIPNSVGAGELYTNTLIFPLDSGDTVPHFYNIFIYATDYSDNFDYYPAVGVYRDRWNDARAVQYGITILASGQLITGYISVKSTNSSVSITLTIRRTGLGAITINHPTYIIPVSMVDYDLSN